MLRGSASAQTPAVWGELEPGPYGVGYRADFRIDRTRGYVESTNPDSGRPMQISIWYPTDGKQVPGERMTTGAYVRMQAGALGPAYDTDERQREFEIAMARGPLSRFFDGDMSDDELARVLATPMAAVRGARPADGRYPVVIHGGFSLTGQTVLLEYLASHGFVILSVPLLGTAPAWFGRGQGTPEWYQAGAGDTGFLHAYAHDLDVADSSRMAMIGMFSAFGLLYQMQHQQLNAIASLDGNYPTALRLVPGFDSVAVRIPILDMPRANPTADRSILDGLRFADRYLVQMEGISHGDFYQFQRLAHPDHAAEHTAYRTIAETTLLFLKHALSDTGPAPGGDVVHLAAARPSLTAEEFLLLLRDGRFDAARRAWLDSSCRNERCRLAPESDITTTLLFYRRDHGPRAALSGFRLLSEMYPESRRALDHLETTRRTVENP